MKLYSLIAALLVFATAAVSWAVPQQEAEEPRQPVCVFFVRHAETAASTRTNRDPELSEAGGKRAAALMELLARSGVTHLYGSEFQRTQQTLAPLAKRTGVEIQVIAAGQAEQQLASLRHLPPGSVAVVAGHSNTVPAMVAALGQAPGQLEQGSLAHESYDRLFLVILPGVKGAEAKTLELSYGG